MEMKLAESPITSLVRKIRDQVNIPWRNFILRQDNAKFSQLCSSMDMIDDADNAIRAYASGEYPSSKPFLYLSTIGVLQALVLQQDAVMHLAQSLNFDFKWRDCPGIIEIRDLRNASIGHPTRRDIPKSSPINYNRIIQVSLSRIGFELLTYYEDGRNVKKYVNVVGKIAVQTEFLSYVLNNILAKIFHPSIDYHCQVVISAACLQDDLHYGLINLETVIAAARNFRVATKARDEELYLSYADDFELLEHIYSQLASYFQAGIEKTTPSLDILSAEIFARFLQSLIQSFQQRADEIDKDYEIED